MINKDLFLMFPRKWWKLPVSKIHHPVVPCQHQRVATSLRKSQAEKKATTSSTENDECCQECFEVCSQETTQLERWTIVENWNSKWCCSHKSGMLTSPLRSLTHLDMCLCGHTTQTHWRLRDSTLIKPFNPFSGMRLAVVYYCQWLEF